jgi:hypothetical protein
MTSPQTTHELISTLATIRDWPPVMSARAKHSSNSISGHASWQRPQFVQAEPPKWSR